MIPPLQTLLTRLFARMRPSYLLAVRRWADGGAHGQPPSLAAWLPVMQEAVRPALFPLWQAGARRGLRSILGQLTRTQRKCWRLNKDLAHRPTIGLDFELFNTRILEALDGAVFDFCRSTLDTIRGDVGTAVERLRQDYREAMERGETARGITARVQRIFADPQRAFTIATTETQRAVHGGQLLVAEESSIVKSKRWLASSDACDKCLAMAALGEIPLDQPFYVDPKGGPYAVVQHPPKHPRCMCSLLEVVDYDALEPRRQAPFGMGGLAVRERLGALMGEL